LHIASLNDSISQVGMRGLEAIFTVTFVIGIG